MKGSNLKIAVSMLAVFLSGIAVGGVGYRLYTVKSVDAKAPAPPKSPEDYRAKYVAEMNARLHLEPAQSVKLNEILDQTRTLFKAEKQRGKTAMKLIHDGQVEQVRSILSDAQKAEYQKVQDEREKQITENEKNNKH